MTTTAWVRLEIEADEASEEALVAHLHAAGLPGWEVLDGDGGRPCFRVWVLPEDVEAVETALGQRADFVLRKFEPEPFDDWASGWAPVRVGPFALTSIGAPIPDLAVGEHLVWVPPSLAFGGGEHATTRLCLRALPGLVERGQTVLDIGSGSGVLSVAAARLGAARVDAVDVDPTARRATARAAEANGAPVQVLEEGLDAARGPYDLVLANILAPTLVELAPEVLALRSPPARVLLSGLRVEGAAAVLAAYAPLVVLSEEVEEGWRAMVLGPDRS